MACSWMILDAWSYQVIYPITFTFGIVPFVQELVIVCNTSDKFKIMKVVHANSEAIAKIASKKLAATYIEQKKEGEGVPMGDVPIGIAPVQEQP